MSLSEESKGLWHNIRVKKARGEKSARKGSDAHNKVVAAAKKINATNEEREEEQDIPARTTTTGSTKAMPNAYYEVSMCNECAIALLEDIKAGKILMTEAEYQGRKVPLGKPMRGDVKKFKVYVKKGDKVVKVNFGDPNMKIKKSNPERRKSFRARHRCYTPGPRWKARYWSCRKW